MLVGSMFTAVSEFIRQSLSPADELSRLTYGKNTIVIGRGKSLYAAAVIFGEPGEVLKEELKEMVDRVEHAYAGVIENWDGGTDRFQGVQELVAPLFMLTAGVTRDHVVAAARELARY